MHNTFSSSLNISSIFLCNILPAAAPPNGSYLYLYLPNWQDYIVKYDDFFILPQSVIYAALIY